MKIKFVEIMKKLLLSAFIVVSFVFYSLAERQRLAVKVQGLEPLGNSSPVPTDGLDTSSKISDVPINTATPTPRVVATPKPSQSGYKDGQYTGKSYDAYYGYVQVGAKIQGGRIVDVTFLRFPNDRGHSVMVSNYSLPILKQEAIQAQSANVNIVSGATDTSLAFRQSLSSALAQAR